MTQLPKIATLKLTALELGLIMGLFLDWRHSNRNPGPRQPFEELLLKLNKEASKIYAKSTKPNRKVRVKSG